MFGKYVKQKWGKYGRDSAFKGENERKPYTHVSFADRWCNVS